MDVYNFFGAFKERQHHLLDFKVLILISTMLDIYMAYVSFDSGIIKRGVENRRWGLIHFHLKSVPECFLLHNTSYAFYL